MTVAVIEKEAVVAGWSGVEQWADRASQVDQRQYPAGWPQTDPANCVGAGGGRVDSGGC